MNKPVDLTDDELTVIATALTIARSWIIARNIHEPDATWSPPEDSGGVPVTPLARVYLLGLFNNLESKIRVEGIERGAVMSPYVTDDKITESVKRGENQ